MVLFTVDTAVAAFSKPNIVLVFVDDWRHADVSFRNPIISTPNFQDLADNGLILNRHLMSTTASSTTVEKLQCIFATLVSENGDPLWGVLDIFFHSTLNEVNSGVSDYKSNWFISYQVHMSSGVIYRHVNAFREWYCEDSSAETVVYSKLDLANVLELLLVPCTLTMWAWPILI